MKFYVKQNILLLPQINILIFKTLLQIEGKISSDFISVSYVKTLIRAFLVCLTECLNEWSTENLHILTLELSQSVTSLSKSDFPENSTNNIWV